MTVKQEPRGSTSRTPLRTISTDKMVAEAKDVKQDRYNGDEVTMALPSQEDFLRMAALASTPVANSRGFIPQIEEDDECTMAVIMAR